MRYKPCLSDSSVFLCVCICVCLHEIMYVCLYVVKGGMLEDNAERCQESSDLICSDGNEHPLCSADWTHLLPDAFNSS